MPRRMAKRLSTGCDVRMIGISTDTIVRATVFSRCSTRRPICKGRPARLRLCKPNDSGPRILCSLLASRDYPVIDYQTMCEFIGRERLFRATDGTFPLHMSSEGKLEAEERIVWLNVRDAMSWVNEAPDEFASFWECAVEAPVEQKQTQHMSPTF